MVNFNWLNPQSVVMQHLWWNKLTNTGVQNFYSVKINNMQIGGIPDSDREERKLTLTAVWCFYEELKLSDVLEDFVQLLNWLQSLWLSSTIINSRIFSLQTVHLQIHLLSAVFSGDGEPAFHWLRVVDVATVIADKSDPLQSFSRSLSDPVHVDTECESRGCAGQCVRFSRPFNHWFRFCQSLTINTCQNKQTKRYACQVLCWWQR